MSEPAKSAEETEAKKKDDDSWSFGRVVAAIAIGAATFVAGSVLLDKWRESAARRRQFALERDEIAERIAINNDITARWRASRARHPHDFEDDV